MKPKTKIKKQIIIILGGKEKKINYSNLNSEQICNKVIEILAKLLMNNI